jgi:hypothetical protein
MVNRAKLSAAFNALQDSLSDPEAMQRSASYARIRVAYERQLGQAVRLYLNGGNRRTYVNAAKQVMVTQYGATADLFLPLESAELGLLNTEVADESGYLEGWFGDLAVQRSAKQIEPIDERLAFYVSSMDALFNQLNAMQDLKAKVFWQRGATEVGCIDCLRLDGQLHAMSYYVARNFIPGKPGAAMKCGGYNCDCSWIDQKGRPVSYAG